MMIRKYTCDGKNSAIPGALELRPRYYCSICDDRQMWKNDNNAFVPAVLSPLRLELVAGVKAIKPRTIKPWSVGNKPP